MLRYPSSEIRITPIDLDNVELLQRQLKEKLKDQQQQQQRQEQEQEQEDRDDDQPFPPSPSSSINLQHSGFMQTDNVAQPDPGISSVRGSKATTMVDQPESSKRKRPIQDQRTKLTRQRLGLDSIGQKK
ncbi:hypothetical protein [Absidia glauca]|uniref:Uncharacterized protein n=1 Tax=Absidia glauca TaxID=4829 RepID=A0A168PHB1_ABSGL|nr:hypothetical protein [Absidia glauca]